MRKHLPTLALAALLVAPAAAFAQVTFDVHIGTPPPPPHAYHVPPQPGPDYVWVEGYQYPQGGHYKWHDGYWTRPPYAGAYWVAPYHSNNQYYAGHWEGNHGNVNHNHGWDHSPQRDEHHNGHPSGTNNR
jgi:hypothetical protein